MGSVLEAIGWGIFGTTVGKFVFIVLLFAMPMASLLTWMERRQSAYSQDRLGPQSAHLFSFRGKPVVLLGLVHILADGLKMFFKEHFIPAGADRGVFLMAPLFGFVTSIVILALIPFGPDAQTALGALQLQIARVDAGILYVFAIASLGIYGAALAGWASNNRFALLGGLRAAAQQISYEIALGLTVVGVLIAYGSTELSSIVRSQGGLAFHGLLPNWGIFVQPLGAMLFLIAAMAETKRTPFDMPEGESEIIGYYLEYSSMSFGLFMLGEFIEVVAVSALFVTLFLGGWHFPWILGDASVDFGFFSTTNPWVYALTGLVVFGVKTLLVCALQLQIRWTLPRFRYDQLMRIGWKNLLPLALLNIFVTALLVWGDPTLGWSINFGVASIAVFILVTIAGPRRAAPAHAHGH
jgi:NADH-quinone oxidoreductase subunit H